MAVFDKNLRIAYKRKNFEFEQVIVGVIESSNYISSSTCICYFDW